MAERQLLPENAPSHDNAASSISVDADPSPGGGLLGTLGLAGLAVIATVSSLWNAITSDGVLAAAARQGADEIGMALRAFPDSIQTHEPGQILEPTQGEIAAGRDHGGRSGNYTSYSHSSLPPHPWPSEVAQANRQNPGNDHGQDHSHDQGYSL